MLNISSKIKQIREVYMKYHYPLLAILLISSCTSSQKIAEYRNVEFSNSNNYETFKFWRELDIQRFENELLKVKIGILPKDIPISDIPDHSYIQTVYDSIQIQIENRNTAFRKFKKEYFDTTKKERTKIFNYLKSDSMDILLLTNLSDNPYLPLYEDLIYRTQSAIQNTFFYSSELSFENYIQNRSFFSCQDDVLLKIFGSEPFSYKDFTDLHWELLEKQGIDFLIMFSIDFATDYSEEAREHIGSERIRMTLLDVLTGNIITSAEISHFWGNNIEEGLNVKDDS